MTNVHKFKDGKLSVYKQTSTKNWYARFYTEGRYKVRTLGTTNFNTTKRFISSHYHLLYFIKPPVSKIIFNEFMSDGDQSQYLDREDVWTIDREYKPPTMIKNQNELPTKLVEKIIQYSSNTGDKVMDMFLGGFTTARVAVQLNGAGQIRD